jgi:peptidoglycan/xylan/chitin deacetylase (PgdA/CDA1 family)
MLSFIRNKIVLTILGIATIVGGVSFFMHTSATDAWTKFRNNQVLYAEMPVTVKDVPPVSVPNEEVKVPILVYHIIRPSYPTDSRQVLAIAHTPEVFDAEMKYLSDAQYHVISFSALLNYFNKGTPLPTNPIIISFDDGWSDQFTYAFPILVKYQYLATFFVFTNPIGTRGFLTWDNLRAMRDAGMTIGSHTRSHPFLTKITNSNSLWNEINGSKQTLEKNLDITVNEFAYPFGQYDATTTTLVKKAGYLSARGDYMKKGGLQSIDKIYELNALNAPTTTELFMRKFPILK